MDKHGDNRNDAELSLEGGRRTELKVTIKDHAGHKFIGYDDSRHSKGHFLSELDGYEVRDAHDRTRCVGKGNPDWSHTSNEFQKTTHGLGKGPHHGPKPRTLEESALQFVGELIGPVVTAHLGDIPSFCKPESKGKGRGR